MLSLSVSIAKAQKFTTSGTFSVGVHKLTNGSNITPVGLNYAHLYQQGINSYFRLTMAFSKKPRVNGERSSALGIDYIGMSNFAAIEEKGISDRTSLNYIGILEESVRPAFGKFEVVTLNSVGFLWNPHRIKSTVPTKDFSAKTNSYGWGLVFDASLMYKSGNFQRAGIFASLMIGRLYKWRSSNDIVDPLSYNHKTSNNLIIPSIGLRYMFD